MTGHQNAENVSYARRASTQVTHIQVQNYENCAIYVS